MTALDPAEVYVYVPPEVCTHEHTEDVFVILDRTSPREATYGNGGRPIAVMCTHCLAVLPLGFGCGDCEWVEAPRRMCDTRQRYELGRPCEEHARC